jgi:hypothetical protein
MPKPNVMKGEDLWLDGNDSDTIEADFWGDVSGWCDKTYNHANFRQPRREFTPKTGIRAINGKNVLSFDGKSSTIHGMKNIKVGSILIVARVDFGYNNLSGLFCEALKDENNIRLQDNFEFRGNSNTNSQDITYGGGEMFINGAVSQKIYPQTPFLLTVFPAEPRLFTPLLSQNLFSDRFWKGDIAEVELYDHRLDKADQASEENYLSVKWGI